MARKGFKRKFSPFEILSKEDVSQIKLTTLDILKETGMIIENKKALKLLERNECIVNFETNNVRFPEGLVEECIKRCPSSFRVKARDERNDLIFGGNTVYFISAPGMDYVDIETWERRTPTEKEYIDAVKVLDSLEHHDLFSCYTPYFGYEGVPEVMKMTMGFTKRIKYSTKFTGLCFANNNWDFNFKIAKEAGMEVLIPGSMVSSPLTLSDSAVDVIFKTLEFGFPNRLETGSVLGSTAPATISGAMAEFNAELIAGLVLIQLIKPYSRILVGGFPNVQNMRTGAPGFGNIAIALFNVANNQIWRDYNVPIKNTAPVYTSSKKIDFQNGIERGVPAILSAISGANAIQLYGGIYGEITHSPIQAILDDDLVGMIGRFIEGVDVTDDTLALDLIHSVGPIPGHFLDKKHTLNWWKKEQYMPECADLLTYPEWEQSGKKDCLDYAKKKMEKILSEHEVSIELNNDQEEKIKKIVEELEEFYRKRGELS